MIGTVICPGVTTISNIPKHAIANKYATHTQPSGFLIRIARIIPYIQIKINKIPAGIP